MIRRRRTLIQLLFAMSLVVAVTAVATPAVAAADSFSAVTIFSDRYDWVGSGQQRLFDSNNGSVTVRTLNGSLGYLTVHVSGGTNGDSAEFYIGRRRVAGVHGRRLRRAVQIGVPSGPFRLVLLLHVTRHGRKLTLRETLTSGACGQPAHIPRNVTLTSRH